MKQRKNYDVTVIGDENLQPTHEEIRKAVHDVINKKIHDMSAEEVPRSGEFRIDVTFREDIV